MLVLEYCSFTPESSFIEFYLFTVSFVRFVPLTEYFSPFSDGAVAALLENEEDEADDAPLVTCR